MSPNAPTVGEHPFQTLRPGHRSPAFDRYGLLQIPCRGTPPPAPQGTHHPPPVPAIGREYPMEMCLVDPTPGHQGGQLGDEIQRLEDDVRGAVAIRLSTALAVLLQGA